MDEEGPSWCRVESRRSTEEGLLYVKTPKTGSSTVAGIVQRIARSEGKRLYHNDSAVCSFRADHVIPRETFAERDRNLSFMFSTIRHPSKRAISRVFYTYVSQRNWSTSDASIMKALNKTSRHFGAISTGKGGHHMGYLSMKKIKPWSAWNASNVTQVLSPRNVHKNVQHIVNSYDFLMISERMDESLVALQLLLGVESGDILALPAKVSGEYSLGGKKECIKLMPSFTSPAIQTFLMSDEWYAKNYGDFLLYAAANRSLDLTIERLGRSRFDAAMSEYRRLMALVDEVCFPELIPRCSVTGERQFNATKCYTKDAGCGFQCIDQLLLQDEKDAAKALGDIE